MKYCHNCGTENNDSNLFCISCGTKLIDVANLSGDFVVKDVEHVASTDAIDSKKIDESKEILVASNTSNEIIACSSKNELKISNIQDDISRVDENVIINVSDNHVDARKVNKKKIFVVILLFILVLLSFLLGPKAIHYFNGQKALKSGNYEMAIDEYSKAEGLLNSNNRIYDAMYLLGEKYYLNVDCDNAYTYLHVVPFYGNAQEYLFDIGNYYYSVAGDNEKAALAYADVDSDEGKEGYLICSAYLELEKEMDKTNYLERDYSSAKAYFEKVKNYGWKYADTCIACCDFSHARDLISSGYLNQALSILETLPSNLDVLVEEAGIEPFTPTYTETVNLLKSNKKILDLCGTWTVTKSYVETRNSYDYVGDNWVYNEHLFDDQVLSILCFVNNDLKTFNIYGWVDYRYYDDYYSYAFDLSQMPKLVQKSFIIPNATSMPSTYVIDSDTKLKYSSEGFKLEYKKKIVLDAYGRNIYTTNVTYGIRIDAF